MTISVQWAALQALAASLAVCQGLLFLLARGLGCRLSWKAAALANALAGHPETALVGTLLAAVCALSLKRRRTSWGRVIASTSVALLLGLGLAAPQVLPFLRILPETQRAVRALTPGPSPSSPRPIPGRGEKSKDSSSASFVSSGLPSPGGGVGGAGRGAGVFDRFLPVAALALGLAGALGIEELLRRRPVRFAWGAPFVAAAASLAVRHDLRLVVLWSLILGGLFMSRRWRAAAGVVLAVALLADLLPWGWDFLPTGHRELFYPRTAFVAAATSAASPEGGGGPWRAAAEGFLFYPSLFPAYGTAELRPHNPVALGGPLALLERVFAFQPEGRRYKSAFHNADHPLLSFLNVRVLVSRDNLPPHPGFERIDGGRFAPKLLYRNPDALPRLFLPVAARVRPRSEALDAVAGLDNPRRVILISEEVGEWRPPERRPWDPAAVRILEWRPGRIAAEVPAEGEKLLAGSLPRGLGGARRWLSPSQADRQHGLPRRGRAGRGAPRRPAFRPAGDARRPFSGPRRPDRRRCPAAGAAAKKRPRSVAGFGGGRFGEEIVVCRFRLHTDIRTPPRKRLVSPLFANGPSFADDFVV